MAEDRVGEREKNNEKLVVEWCLGKKSNSVPSLEKSLENLALLHEKRFLIQLMAIVLDAVIVFNI